MVVYKNGNVLKYANTNFKSLEEVEYWVDSIYHAKLPNLSDLYDEDKGKSKNEL